MKYKIEMKCRIDLTKPEAELADTISAVLQQYPPQRQRSILQSLELEIATALNALDQVQQIGDDIREGGDAGEPAKSQEPQEPKEPEPAG